MAADTDVTDRADLFESSAELDQEIEPKPTLQDVQYTLEDRRNHRQKLRQQVREDLELYRQAYEIDLPPAFHQVNTPTTTTVVDRLADRLGSATMIAHLEPRGHGESEKKRVEKVEKALLGIFELARRRNKYNLKRGMAHHGASRGGFVVKCQIDPAGWQGAPERASGESEVEHERRIKLWKYRAVAKFPILLGVRPIENIYPDPETDGDESVIEHYRRRVGDIKKNYPNWRGWQDLLSGGKKFRDERGRFARYNDDTVVDYTEGYTRDWRFVSIENQWVPIGSQTEENAGPVRNLFGRPPYFLRYAGFGDPEGAPEERCRSILRPARTTFIAMTRLLSIIDTVAENEAYGATLLKRGDSGNLNFSIAPGAKNEMDDPASVKSYRPEGLNPMVLQALGIMQGVAEQGSVPSEAIGQQPPGRRGTVGMSGIGAAIVTGQASMIVSPLLDAMQDCIADISTFLLYLVDAVVPRELPVVAQVGEKEFVNITLDAKTIDGHYGPVYVKLVLKDPEEDYARQEAGIRGLQAGLPLEFVLEEYYRRENAGSMMRSMIARQIAFHPDMLSGYYIPRLQERLKAKTSGSAERMPLSGVVAPAGYVPPQPMGGGTPMGGDLRALAGAQIAPGPGGDGYVTPGDPSG